MNALHGALNSVTAAVMRPLAALPPWVGLVVASLVFGVIAAVAYRYTSPQAALRRVADQIRANLLSMRLFKDDMWITLKAQGALLRAAGLRLLFSLPPLAVMLVPFVLLAAQLAMYYEFRPLAPGEPARVEMQVLPERWGEVSAAELTAPDGIKVEAVVRDPAAHTITWRFRAEREVGPQRLVWRLGEGAAVDKAVVVRDDAGRIEFVSPVRAGPSVWERLLYPGEPAFDRDSPVQRISVAYASRSTPIFGLNVHWIITLVVVSILGAFLVKPFMKVQF